MTITELDPSTTDETLYFLRLKGLATDEALAGALGADVESARARASALVAAGLATRRETPRLSGTQLSPAGRERADAVLARLASGPETAIHRDLLERFLPVNSRFKEVCVRWQSRGDGRPNVHDDPAFDARILAELDEVHEEVTALLAGASGVADSLARYPVRLTGALARVKAGETGALLRPMSESYHDVWMELHQDLINRSGRERDETDEH